MSERRKVANTTQFHVLYLSARRCCLCYGLNHDYSEKKGQIAHLDHDRSNNSIENLAWLCLSHHDEYDSKGSQSKAYGEYEVKQYRQALYNEVSRLREIPNGINTVEILRFKRKLIEDNLAIFFFAAFAMYDPPFRDVLLKEVKDPDFRVRLEDAWMYLSEPASDDMLSDPQNRELMTRLHKMAQYLSSSDHGKEDLKTLLGFAGAAINAMKENERNDALFAIHNDSIRSSLLLLRKLYIDRTKNG